MLANPRLGQAVRLRYRKGHPAAVLYQDAIGRVVIVCRGRPRNHGIEIEGRIVVVPCGQLFKLEEKAS